MLPLSPTLGHFPGKTFSVKIFPITATCKSPFEKFNSVSVVRDAEDLPLLNILEFTFANVSVTFPFLVAEGVTDLVSSLVLYKYDLHEAPQFCSSDFNGKVSDLFSSCIIKAGPGVLEINKRYTWTFLQLMTSPFKETFGHRIMMPLRVITKFGRLRTSSQYISSNCTPHF